MAYSISPFLTCAFLDCQTHLCQGARLLNVTPAGVLRTPRVPGLRQPGSIDQVYRSLNRRANTFSGQSSCSSLLTPFSDNINLWLSARNYFNNVIIAHKDISVCFRWLLKSSIVNSFQKSLKCIPIEQTVVSKRAAGSFDYRWPIRCSYALRGDR